MFRAAVVASITVAASWFLAKNVDAPDVMRLLARVEAGWAAAGLAVFLFGHWLRYRRYGFVWRWPLGPAFRATAVIHGFASYVLPLRLGELVLPVMVRRQGVTGFTSALGGLLLVRLFDALLVLAAGGVVLLAQPGLSLPHPVPDLFTRPSIMLVGTLLCGAGLWWVGARLTSNHAGWRRLAFPGLSLGIWLSVAAMNLAVLRALGLEVTPVVLVLLLAFGVLVTVLPLQGFAGLGAHQIVWVLSLTAGGMDARQALDVSLASHVIIVLYVCVLGLAGLALGLAATAGDTGK